jgi:NAD/NADP transhydrogenase beta subunit
MKISVTILYVVAGLLLLFSIVALSQVFTASRAVENALFGYRIAFGPLVDAFAGQIVSVVRGFFLLIFAVLLGGSGASFALALLLLRSRSQTERIRELEAELAEFKAEFPRDKSVFDLPRT